MVNPMNHKVVSIQDLAGLIEEQIKQNKSVKLQVSGNSMRPFYKHQKTVVCLEQIHSPLKKYDVVLYRNFSGQYLLHRIIEVKGNMLVICGDALRKKEYLDYEHMIARVAYHEYQGKIISEDDNQYVFRVKLWHFLRFIRFLLLQFYPYQK